MTKAYIAEYGGLGANTDNVASYGTSCVYDSQGNLYVIGAAFYGNNSGGAPSGSNFVDSLMLKYSPDGQLLFHKTWWDAENQNCGATNVAIDIVNVGGTDYILWLANDWSSNGGCFYGVMDTNGNIGQGGVDQANAGIGQISPTDIFTNSTGAAAISTRWLYNGNDIPAVVSIPDIINSGTPGFSTGIEIVNTDASPSTGVFNAVVVDDAGYTTAIGNIIVDDVTHAFLASFDPAGAVIWQYVLDENTTTGAGQGCYGESLAWSPDGYLYTVVNDTDIGSTYIDKFETFPSGVQNIWRATIAANGPGMLCGYDINFDSAGNPIVSGLSSTSVNNGTALGIPGIVKVNKTTGSLIFANFILLGDANETIFDGSSGDPFVGHRCGAVYQDRFAFACTTTNDLNFNDAGTVNDRLLICQVPTDGSIATIYEGGPPSNGYLNVTGIYGSSFSVSNYQPGNTSYASVDLTTILAALSNPMMATTNATTVNDYGSELLTLGNFGGLTMRPGVNIRPGVTLRGSNNSFSITMTSADFTHAYSYNSTNGHSYPIMLGTNGVDGFTIDFTNVSSDNGSWIYTSYIPYNPHFNNQSIADFFNNLVTQGVLNQPNQSALWSVTWAAGSSITNGYVIMSGRGTIGGILIAPVDTTVTGWNTNPPNNDSTTALAGTFLFPATFTLVTPAINKGGWC